jgi:NAD(P)-dependent dehydrogenase (short-subunit alcohol dehydrogenase family)
LGVGTSSGFGKRFVISALRRGDIVIATSRMIRSIEDLPVQAEATLKLGGDPADSNPIDLSTRLHLLELDVNWDTEAIHAAVNEALKIHGRIDVLVNNAGYAYKNIVEDVG